ncbi:MAG TPA: hypothetical protein PLO65_05150 [Caulobacter sp.]|nr:hypothetical protein [Caulobacter sp.]
MFKIGDSFSQKFDLKLSRLGPLIEPRPYEEGDDAKDERSNLADWFRAKNCSQREPYATDYDEQNNLAPSRLEQPLS